MSRFSPTVVARPRPSFWDSLGAGLQRGVDLGVREYDLAQQRKAQAARDAATAKQQALANAFRERQLALEEEAARRQQETQDRLNAEAGYTPASDTTVDLGPLGQAFAAVPGGAAITGAALQSMPATTLHTPARYDPTQSAAFIRAQQAATLGAERAAREAERSRATHRANRDYDIAHPLPRRSGGSATGPSSAAARAAIARDQYLQGLASSAVQAAGGDPQEAIQILMDSPDTRNVFSQGMSGRHIKAAAQAFGERPAVRGGNAPDPFDAALQAAMQGNGSAPAPAGAAPAAPTAPAQVAAPAAPAMAPPPPVPASQDPRQQAIFQAATLLNQTAARLLAQGMDPARVRAALETDLQTLGQDPAALLRQLQSEP